MTQINRRGLLGSAALGVGGLIGLAGEVRAASPGGGGFGRNATALPPGDKVVPHERGEKEDMPDFKYSLDGSTPKVTSGGWAKEATVHQFPISKGIAGVHMFLDPGASRELHWHAIAAEWAYVLEGQCQTVVVDPSGQREVNNFGPGDLWYFPKGHGHSIQTIGAKPCHFVLSFDNGAFSEHGTFSVTDWVSLTSKEMLAANFGVPAGVFDAFPKGETYIMAGPVLLASEAKDAPLPAAQSHKFSLDSVKPHETDGGSLRLATAQEFPMSQGMSGGVMLIKPGAIREMHWHPNANEWHYYLRGTAQVGLFGSGGRGKVATFQSGDVAYLPAGYGHAIRNVGTDDLELVVTFDSGTYQEISLSQLLAASPRYLLSNNFGVPEATFAGFPEKPGFIRMPQ